MIPPHPNMLPLSFVFHIVYHWSGQPISIVLNSLASPDPASQRGSGRRGRLCGITSAACKGETV